MTTNKPKKKISHWNTLNRTCVVGCSMNSVLITSVVSLSDSNFQIRFFTNLIRPYFSVPNEHKCKMRLMFLLFCVFLSFKLPPNDVWMHKNNGKNSATVKIERVTHNPVEWSTLSRTCAIIFCSVNLLLFRICGLFETNFVKNRQKMDQNEKPIG